MTKGASANNFAKLALLVSPTERAEQAAEELRGCADWVPLGQADAAVALGGDGFMLGEMHRMIDADRLLPVYGLNLGTVGFLMNRYTKGCRVIERIAKSRPIAVSPLKMDAVTQGGGTHSLYAINEVSLLRE